MANFTSVTLLLFATGRTSGSYSQKRCLFSRSIGDLLSTLLQSVFAVTPAHRITRTSIEEEIGRRLLPLILNIYEEQRTRVTTLLTVLHSDGLRAAAELTIIVRPMKRKTAGSKTAPSTTRLSHSTIQFLLSAISSVICLTSEGRKSFQICFRHFSSLLTLTHFNCL